MFDCEYVPDIATGRRVYRLSPEMPDDLVLKEMYLNAPPDTKNPDNPAPMLKTFMHRVVSVSAVVRDARKEAKKKLQLRTLPDPLAMSERDMLFRFLSGVGGNKMQLVGFASRLFDVPVLAQRALVHGLAVPEFFSLPEKPWLGTDYLARYTDAHVDLFDVVSLNGDPKSKPKLDEIAAACGIPGKLGVSGADVAGMVLGGRLAEVVAYNECDAATTYLLWLRAAATAGLLDYVEEAGEFRDLVEEKAKTEPHMAKFLEAWK